MVGNFMNLSKVTEHKGDRSENYANPDNLTSGLIFKFCTALSLAILSGENDGKHMITVD